EFGYTPLHDVSGGEYSSEEAGISVAQLLLERGEDVNVQTKQQQTPLHLASYNGKLEIAHLLLDRGAKLDAADEIGQTPLHSVSRGEYSSEEASVSVAQLLLERGEDVNANIAPKKQALVLCGYCWSVVKM
ncbi:Ankyrin repeat-containing domain protein, partial [Lactarius tabidus]